VLLCSEEKKGSLWMEEIWTINPEKSNGVKIGSAKLKVPQSTKKM